MSYSNPFLRSAPQWLSLLRQFSYRGFGGAESQTQPITARTRLALLPKSHQEPYVKCNAHHAKKRHCHFCEHVKPRSGFPTRSVTQITQPKSLTNKMHKVRIKKS